MMNSEKLYHKLTLTLTITTLLFIVVWVAHVIYVRDRFENILYVQIRENSPEYRYINPVLYTDNSNVKYPQLNRLSKNLSEYIRKNEDKAERISVYFRDLNTSMWTGIDEDELYVPSSMFKILPLIEYLKLAENDPDIFNQLLPYKKTVDSDIHYPPRQKIENGFYSPKVLLGQSIIYSDNDAHDALMTPIIERELGNFYKNMQLSPLPEKLQNYLSPRDMSRIFRTLYNSTYLTKSYSEQALELLTKTDFTKGIVSGVEAKIAVAHKFGEYTEYPTGLLDIPNHQLHDCGIIYYPKKPYLLCVMTMGKNFNNLEEVISNISKIVFSYVNEN